MINKNKCDHCSFEAESARGLKTHIGPMHKDQEKAEHNPEIQIYICVFVNIFIITKKNLPSMQIHMHIQETLHLLIGCSHPLIKRNLPTFDIPFISKKQHNCSSER